jgi:DNA primase
MAKTYIDTVKYIVHANCEIDGLVEKPDVVGAIFGQTEGLLGDELDLRELQKNGRIGRIVVDLQAKGGKSVGVIKIPSSLDMVETSIIAAALETVDRVGPCEAKIKVEKIEDTRNLKRNMVIERAKSLLKTILEEEIPESKEITEQVRAEVRAAEISTYGPDKLPAGPNIEQKDSIILVEGRADVLNLLKNDITNVVGIGGANISPTVVELTKQKEVIVFLDGDRGGDIILSELARVGDIDYVARAPRGKEVEELTRKEIIKCLRAKVPFEQRMVFSEKETNNYQSSSTNGYNYQQTQKEEKQRVKPYLKKQQYQEQPIEQSQQFEALRSKTKTDLTENEQKIEQIYELEDLEQQIEDKIEDIEQKDEQKQNEQIMDEQITKYFRELEEELNNSQKARIYKNKDELYAEVPVRDIIKKLEEAQEDLYALVYDGFVTKRVVEIANQKGIKIIVALKLGNLFKKPEGIIIKTKE